jgi:hypothetical protein
LPKPNEGMKLSQHSNMEFSAHEHNAAPVINDINSTMPNNSMDQGGSSWQDDLVQQLEEALSRNDPMDEEMDNVHGGTSDSNFSRPSGSRLSVADAPSSSGSSIGHSSQSSQPAETRIAKRLLKGRNAAAFWQSGADDCNGFSSLPQLTPRKRSRKQ